MSRKVADKDKGFGTCKACGRPLSSPASVLAGYGPVCLHNHYASGQKDYVSSLFSIDYDRLERKVASFDVASIGEDAVLITDLDDDPDSPSVTNSIDEILARLKIDKHKVKVVCLGTDGMYTQYNGTWKFAGWTIEEVKENLKIKER